LIYYVDLYYKLGKVEKARKLANILLKRFKEYLLYYADMPLQEKFANFDDIEHNFLLYREILRIITENKDETFAEDKFKEFEMLMNKYQDMLQDDESTPPPPAPNPVQAPAQTPDTVPVPEGN